VHHPSLDGYPCPWPREICPDGWGGIEDADDLVTDLGQALNGL
jgi:hypothetical protein